MSNRRKDSKKMADLLVVTLEVIDFLDSNINSRIKDKNLFIYSAFNSEVLNSIKKYLIISTT